MMFHGDMLVGDVCAPSFLFHCELHAWPVLPLLFRKVK